MTHTTSQKENASKMTTHEATPQRTLHEQFLSITKQLNDLRKTRDDVASQLVVQGIEADRVTRDDRRTSLSETQAEVDRLSALLISAERRKRALNARIDSGDDSVTPLEVVEADMALRTTTGKLRPARAELKRSERALVPFQADDHLAHLAAATVAGLVEVPVLIRKLPSDVHEVCDAVVLSQTSPTQNYGTTRVAGRVSIAEIGTTGLDGDLLSTALEATGADVSLHGSVIDYETAIWPVPPLSSPSDLAVVQFAQTLADVFRATIRQGPKAGSTVYHETRWHTIEQSLTDDGSGIAHGKVVAKFGVEDIYPPLAQMRQFVAQSLDQFNIGTLTSAGLLDGFELSDLSELGPWIEDEDGPHLRGFGTGAFGLTVALTFRYDPITSTAVED